MLKILLEEQQERKTAKVSSNYAIHLCINKVSERFKNLDINGRKIMLENSLLEVTYIF